MKKQVGICTLDEWDWAKKIKNYVILDTPTTSMLQCKVDDKYYSFCNTRRGSIGDEGLPDIVYDVCVSPKDLNTLDKCFLQLLREKIVNMNIVYDAMLEKMLVDGTITKEQSEKFKFKNIEELIEGIKNVFPPKASIPKEVRDEVEAIAKVVAKAIEK